jgi:hypothetical protein
MVSWLTLVIGGVILVVGVLGQFFGVRRGPQVHPDDRHMGRIVLTIGSTVVGLWLVFIAVAHLMRLQVVGRW